MLISYLFTPRSRVLHEKLTDFQLVKKFPASYGTRRFITAYTSAGHLYLSWASSIQSIPPHPTSWRSILILSSHLRLGLQNGLFPWGFPTKTLYTPLLSPIHTTSHSSRFDHPNNIWCRVQIIQLLIMQLPPLPCYLVPLRPKYSRQIPYLKHPHSVFLPQCQQPSFTPIQKTVRIRVLCIIIFVFLDLFFLLFD